jgi:hypothetical protein
VIPDRAKHVIKSGKGQDQRSIAAGNRPYQPRSRSSLKTLSHAKDIKIANSNKAQRHPNQLQHGRNFVPHRFDELEASDQIDRRRDPDWRRSCYEFLRARAFHLMMASSDDGIFVLAR